MQTPSSIEGLTPQRSQEDQSTKLRCSMIIQSDKQKKYLSPSNFTTFKCTKKPKCIIPAAEKHFLEKVLQKLNNGLKSAVRKVKLPADFICYYCSYH